MQVGRKAEGSPESMCIRSQSVPMGPIEGQKFDLHELKHKLCQPRSTNRICISAIDCFVTFPYTYRMVSENKIKKGVDKQVIEPPQSPLWFSPELTVTKIMVLHISQERMMTIQTLHHQAISNVSIYAGRRESQLILGKYLFSVTIAADGST
jgi:hypothetical protein